MTHWQFRPQLAQSLLGGLAGPKSRSQAVTDIFEDDDPSHSSVDSDRQQLEVTVTDAGTIITGSVPSVRGMWVLGRAPKSGG